MNFDELLYIISDYFDRELESEICSEIEEFICIDAECRTLFNTFQETINLCHEIEELEVPRDVHVKLCMSLHIKIERSWD